MGNSSSSPSQICAICNHSTANRPAISPGCCQSNFHQDCLNSLVSSGATLCPTCRTQLPATMLGIPHVIQQPQAIAVPVPPPHFHRSFQNNSTQPSKLLPEEPVQPWIPLSSGELTSALNRTNVAVECIPEFPQISVDSTPEFHTVVSLSTLESTPVSEEANNNAVETEPTTTYIRPPMDIICVLDTSGSMGGSNKLVNLKHAVDYIRSELTENDRMAVINFETSAVIVHNLLLMNEGNKQTTGQLCSQLQPGGGTKIVTGLEAAYNMLSARSTANPITSVFLLTDGIDSSDLAKKKMVARNIKQAGSSLFVFGFGADHDSDHLQSIADAADGTFTYIEQSDMVVDAFGGALGAEQSIVASDVCLSISAVNGVKITAAETGGYRHSLTSNGSETQIHLNSMMIGEERDMLLTLSIPAAGECSDDFNLLTTSVSYVSVGSTETSRIVGRSCTVKRVPKSDIDPNAARDERVDVQFNRMILLRATKESLAAADRNDYQTAQNNIRTALATVNASQSAISGNVKSAAFAAELNATLGCVSDSTAYMTYGGRHELTEQTQTYSKQKMCYKKKGRADVYQNNSSIAFQSKASASKGFF